MNWLNIFGLLAVTLMLICYALEDRNSLFILAFAGACLLGSVYGFLQGAWPFGALEAVWSIVALRRWSRRKTTESYPRRPAARRSNVVGLLLCASLGGAYAAAQEPAKESGQPSTQPASARGPIEDNSFLIEEAYNQEAGVVQHISAFAMRRATRAWAYAFTQEWPLFSQRHQLSFTVPVVSAGRGSGSGVGDIALHYRYQLADGTRSGVLVAPRLSVLLPSGDARRERGAGGAGLQVNLPITVEHSAHFVTHWNAGATLTPSARNALGDEATTRSYNAGGSVIWLALSALNVMLEVAGTRDEAVSGPGERVPSRSLFLSPGVRGAIDFSSGLQIVPGIAVPIGIGPSRGDRKLFLYLSFEHPFSDRGRRSLTPDSSGTSAASRRRDSARNKRTATDDYRPGAVGGPAMGCELD